MSESTFIIAEAGVNHNGSIDLAYRLIDVACEAGADAVKFQTFKATKLASKQAVKANYQTKTTDAHESQIAMLERLELNEAAHQKLWLYCQTKGIEFMSTPFDIDSLDLLVNLGVKRLKVPSGDITNAPLLKKMAESQLPIILSTGMATLADIETALIVLAGGYMGQSAESAYVSSEGQMVLREKITLLHCTTEYPAPLVDVNLLSMKTLTTSFGLPVGYSDHTEGVTISIAAKALGAVAIEKHFTLDRTMEGPDHKASLEPAELQAMVKGIREVEKALGSAVKLPSAVELQNRIAARKSLVAAQNISKGEMFTKQNLAVKRPGSGISAIHYEGYLGRVADKDYKVDDLIV